MKRLWTDRILDAPADVVWQLLTDPAEWPKWGPTVRQAVIDGERLAQGTTGSVTTIAGVTMRFRITDYEEGRRWAWRVAGVDATDHSVEPIGPDRCRVGFGVPWILAPYLAVCQLALGRLDAAAGPAAATGDA